MANKKYELMKDDTIKANGKTLYRIKALVDINHEVKAGDLGGYIESEANLSTKMDESWVYDDAMVFDSALVVFHAHVRDQAMVYGDAEVAGEGGEAEVTDNAKVYGSTVMEGGDVRGTAEVNLTWGSRPGKISGAEISGNAKLIGEGIVYGGEIGGNANFNIPKGEFLVLTSAYYEPSKKVEIKSAAQAKEIFDANNIDYESVEGTSLGD